jgi:hypothetical protein
LLLVEGNPTGDNILMLPPSLTEKILPQIESVVLFITPPIYTGKQKREQGKFGFVAEEGSVIRWHINTNISLKKSLLFNDKDTSP